MAHFLLSSPASSRVNFLPDRSFKSAKSTKSTMSAKSTVSAKSTKSAKSAQTTKTAASFRSKRKNAGMKSPPAGPKTTGEEEEDGVSL